MYFSKKLHAMYNGVWGKAPEAVKLSRISVSYRKKSGEQDELVVPPIVLLGQQLLQLLPRFPRLLFNYDKTAFGLL